MNPACETRSGANRPAEKECGISLKNILECINILTPDFSHSFTVQWEESNEEIEMIEDEIDDMIFKYFYEEGDDE